MTPHQAGEMVAAKTPAATNTALSLIAPPKRSHISRHKTAEIDPVSIATLQL
jgi:hypothetical protein